MSKFVQSKRSELNKYMSTSHMNMMYSYAISNPFRRQNVFPGIWSILLLTFQAIGISSILIDSTQALNVRSFTKAEDDDQINIKAADGDPLWLSIWEKNRLEKIDPDFRRYLSTE